MRFKPHWDPIRLSRRALIAQSVRLGSAACAASVIGLAATSRAEPSSAGEPAITAPGEPGTCPNTTLSAADLSFRESLEYVDQSPFAPEQVCRKCESWVPAQSDPCGQCAILRGLVHARGHCTSWSKA